MQSLCSLLWWLSGKLHPDAAAVPPHHHPTPIFPYWLPASRLLAVVLNVLIDLSPNSITSKAVVTWPFVKPNTKLANYLLSHEWMIPHTERMPFAPGLLVVFQDSNDWHWDWKVNESGKRQSQSQINPHGPKSSDYCQQARIIALIQTARTAPSALAVPPVIQA